MKGDVIMKPSKAAIVRTIILFISLLNVVLRMCGVNTLPIDNELIAEGVSVAVLIASTICSWWYNNSFTEKARKADEYMKNLRSGE